MALNDFIRIIKDASGVRIELRNDPASVASPMVIAPGRIIIPQTAADPGTFEIGSVWNDDATGINKQKDAAGVKDL